MSGRLWTGAARRLDVYAVVSVCSVAVLVGAAAHGVLPLPRRRSASARSTTPRSSSTSPWSTRWTPTSRDSVVVVYVVLRVVHALLLTFSVASLLVQV